MTKRRKLLIKVVLESFKIIEVNITSVQYFLNSNEIKIINY